MNPHRPPQCSGSDVRRFAVILGTLCLALAIAALVAGCGGGGSSGDTTAPVAAFSNPGGTVLDRHAPIVIGFSESMDPTSLVLGGALADVEHIVTWSNSSTQESLSMPFAANDTLTLTPADVVNGNGWGLGLGSDLIIDVNDLAGNALPTLVLEFDLFDGLVFVHPDGNDANDGTPQAPLATVNEGIDRAYGYTGAVLVAAGTYARNYRSDGPVVDMAAYVSLFGGYSATDWTVRDPAVHVSVLQDTSPAGSDASSLDDPNRAVNANAAAEWFHLDGFAIQGGGGTWSTGLFVVGTGTRWVTNNTIQGGSGQTSSAVLLSGRVILTANTLLGGTGSTASYGLYAHDSEDWSHLYGNDISGGTGERSAGIYSSGIDTIWITSGNIIDGGSGDDSYGVYLEIGNASIQDNTITGGSGSGKRWGVYAFNASVTMAHNFVAAGSGTANYTYGIEMAGQSDGLIQLNSRIDGGSGAFGTYGIFLDVAARATIDWNPDIRGGAGTSHSAGVYSLSGHSTPPIIKRNIIDGGTGASYTYGIFNDASGPTINNNTITGGTTNGSATGIYTVGGGQPTIVANRIQGNLATSPMGVTNGIYLGTDSDAIIRNNLVQAGRGIYTYGINAEGAAPTIQNNTIGGGAGTTIAIALRLYADGTAGATAATIQNNILFSTTASGTEAYCMFEADAQSGALLFENNDVFDCSMRYRTGAGQHYYTAADINLYVAAASGNVDRVPVFISRDGTDADRLTLADNDWHLAAATHGDVTTGGLILDGFTVDLDDVTRTPTVEDAGEGVTTGWSMGAYEYDP